MLALPRISAPAQLGEAYFNHPSVRAATTEAAMAAAEARREEDLQLLQAFGEAFSPTRLRTTEPPPLTDFKPSMMPPATAKRLAMWQKKRQTTVLAHPPSTQVLTVGDMVQHMLEKARDAWHRRMCVAALHADFVKADAHVMFSDMLAVRAAVEALLILEAWRGPDEVSVPPGVAASYPETAEFAADTVRACSRESRGGTGRPGLNSKGMEKLYALLRCCSDYTLRAVRGALPVASPSPQVEELLAHITDLLEKAEQERSTQEITAETPAPTPAAAAAASGDGGGGDFLSILLSEQQPPPRARHLGYFASVDENAARRTLDKSRKGGRSLMALAGL